MNDANTNDSTKKVDVYFRGDLAPGQKVVEVRARLQSLFKASDEQLQRLFSGRPVAIRRDLDSETAEQYRLAVLDAGALVELRPVQADEASAAVAPGRVEQKPEVDRQIGEQQAQQQAQAPIPIEESDAIPEGEAAGEALSIAPVGSDMLSEEDRHVVEAVDVDISGLAVEEPGGDILQDSEKKHIAPADIDISHLSVEELPSQ